MTRFVVCGETLIDLVQDRKGSDDSFRSTWLALSAGGPMNSAVALGKLGTDTHFLGRISSDAFGLAELYLLGTLLFRRGLGRYLAEGVAEDAWTTADAVRVAGLIGAGNAQRAYRLG